MNCGHHALVVGLVWSAALQSCLAAPSHDVAVVSESRTFAPGDIFQVFTKTGFVTHVSLDDSEAIVQVAVGDAENWVIVGRPGDHNVYIKPRPGAHRSNLVVTSERNSYCLDLRVLPEAAGDRALTYELRIVLPPARPAAPDEVAAAGTVNWNYTYEAGAHSGDLVPEAAFDDGQLTYLRLPRRRELPVAYEVSVDGAEHLVNFHVAGEFLVLHRVAREFSLRLGPAVVAIWNEAWPAEAVLAPGVPAAEQP